MLSRLLKFLVTLRIIVIVNTITDLECRVECFIDSNRSAFTLSAFTLKAKIQVLQLTYDNMVKGTEHLL